MDRGAKRRVSFIAANPVWKLEKLIGLLPGKSNANRASFTALVDMALSRAQARKADILASASSDTTAEDSDEWINVSPEDLDNALAEAGGLPTAEGSAMDAGDMQPQLDGEAKAQEQAKKLGKLAKKVEAFVEGHGDLDGAVFDECVHRILAFIPSRFANRASLATTCPTTVVQMTSVCRILLPLLTRMTASQPPRSARGPWMHSWPLSTRMSTASCLPWKHPHPLRE